METTKKLEMTVKTTTAKVTKTSAIKQIKDAIANVSKGIYIF